MGVILRMKLLEVEMDLPYQRNEDFISFKQKHEAIEYQEALKMDYEINWKEKRRKFQLMTKCMTSMVERIMKPIITKDCWKIMIECVNHKESQDYKNLLGVYTIEVEINLDLFYSVNSYSKKEMMIDIILKGIKKLSNFVSFELNSIINACMDVINSGYRNEWLWKKVKLNKKISQIKIQHEIDSLNIIMIFLDEYNKPIKEELVVTTIPDERVYGQYLGKLVQVSEDSVALIDKSGKEIIRVCS